MSELIGNKAIHLTKPLGYIDFMSSIYGSRCVITDSGGIQEETSWLGVPCITLRPNTERPITITHGTNILSSADNLKSDIDAMFSSPRRKLVEIPLWDGNTAQRCVDSLVTFFER